MTKTKITFGVIILLALLLRLLFFDSITFFYDQARDAVTSMEIWQGDPLKIIGPRSDFEGLYHGSFYWYLISPFYYLGNGNVFLVKFILILINLINIFVIYDLAKILFKNKRIAFLSAFFFAVSFEAVQYARWLSNPAPAILTITLSFWSLYKLSEGKKWAFITLLISWGLSVQLQLFLIYQLPLLIFLWFLLKGKKLPKLYFKHSLIGGIALLTTLSTYIVSELKFNFQGTKALAKFFSSQAVQQNALWELIKNYPKDLVQLFYLNIWAINYIVAGLAALLTLTATIFLIRNGKKQKQLIFLLVWMLSPILILFISGPDAHYITIGAAIPLIILSAYLINKFVKNKYLLAGLILVISIGNIDKIITHNPHGETLFSIQDGMTIKDELKVIDWIYQEADNKPYKLNTITYPMFLNTTWAHLFNWYGKSKYSYLPFWWGETQVDIPASTIKFAADEPTELHFLIIEPNASSDDYYIKAIKMLENS